MLHNLPRSDRYAGNVCAFCHYWEGDAQMHSHGSYQVEFNERSKGRCLLKNANGKSANCAACPKFQISNDASRYCKR